jgi:hypothetical protein
MNHPRDGRLPRRNQILIETMVIDEAGQLAFDGLTEVDGLSLMVLAESREDLARSKGRGFTEGAIPFFASELVNVVRRGEPQEAVDKAAIDVALAAWLVDSIYGGVSAEAFLSSKLRFTMVPGGAVRYDRISLTA